MSTVQVKLRLAPEVAKRLRARAAADDMTVSEYVEALVGNHSSVRGSTFTPAQIRKSLHAASARASGKRY